MPLTLGKRSLRLRVSPTLTACACQLSLDLLVCIDLRGNRLIELRLQCLRFCGLGLELHLGSGPRGSRLLELHHRLLRYSELGLELLFGSRTRGSLRWAANALLGHDFHRAPLRKLKLHVFAWLPSHTAPAATPALV